MSISLSRFCIRLYMTPYWREPAPIDERSSPSPRFGVPLRIEERPVLRTPYPARSDEVRARARSIEKFLNFIDASSNAAVRYPLCDRSRGSSDFDFFSNDLLRLNVSAAEKNGDLKGPECNQDTENNDANLAGEFALAVQRLGQAENDGGSPPAVAPASQRGGRLQWVGSCHGSVCSLLGAPTH